MSEEQAYSKGQIVLMKNNKNEIIPCQIVKLSFSGIYKIRVLGVKETYEYVNQHKIFSFDVDKIKVNKMDKKMKKVIKIAEKNHKNFQAGNVQNQTIIHQSFMKEQESQSDSEIQQSVDEWEKIIPLSKVDVISQYSIEQLKNDHKNGALSVIRFHQKKQKFIEEEYEPKALLLKRFEWALQEYILGLESEESEQTIKNILESQIFQPYEFFCSSTMKKINEVIETRIIEKRFKIFLKEKKKLLFSGLEAYLSNYYILEHIEKEISKVLK